MTTSVKVVETKYGKVRGKRVWTQNGTPYFAYYGIPYAKPPVGDLRFRPPVAPDLWKEIHDSTNASGVKCTQFVSRENIFEGHIEGQEDCLVLNIFSPITDNDKPLSVLVYIHGGGFTSGSNDTATAGPDFLIDDNVLVISIIYRLGIFGFLNLDLPEAQGNMGLKDQVFALRWVQENISAFNGNPGKVTLFGISAGGASVELHCMSPMSEGLFHQAIIQSGSFLNPWAHNYDIRNYAFRLARNMGKQFDDTKDLLQFFKEVPAKELVAQATALSGIRDKGTERLHFGFVPSIEKSFPDFDAFLTESTLKLLKRGDFLKVPIITGFCRNEGLIIHSMNPVACKSVGENKNFFSCLPFNLTDAEKTKFEERFKQAYLRNADTEGATASLATDYFTDVDFLGGIYLTAALMAKENPNVYFYEFAHDGKLNMMKAFMSINMKGTCHSDDIGYIFKVDALQSATEVDELVRSRLVRMWTNFTKYGNPTPEPNDLLPVTWETFCRENFQFLIINDKLTISRDLYPERIAIYQDLFNTL